MRRPLQSAGGRRRFRCLWRIRHLSATKCGSPPRKSLTCSGGVGSEPGRRRAISLPECLQSSIRNGGCKFPLFMADPRDSSATDGDTGFVEFERDPRRGPLVVRVASPRSSAPPQAQWLSVGNAELTIGRAARRDRACTTGSPTWTRTPARCPSPRPHARWGASCTARSDAGGLQPIAARWHASPGR